jgi:hypothetical protein
MGLGGAKPAGSHLLPAISGYLAADTEISFSVRKPDKMRAFRNKQMEP